MHKKHPLCQRSIYLRFESKQTKNQILAHPSFLNGCAAFDLFVTRIPRMCQHQFIHFRVGTLANKTRLRRSRGTGQEKTECM